MELKVINLKNLKRYYLNFLSLCIMITVGSIGLFYMGVQIFPGSPWVIQLKDVFLYGIVAIGVGFSIYESGQRKKLQALPTVDEKIIFYETFYRNRLWRYVIFCFSSGVLLLLTLRGLFFYFCLFDLLFMLIAWPAEFRIKKEMNENELIFIK